jgi:hypothetical protein
VFGCHAGPWKEWPHGHPAWPDRVGIPILHGSLQRLTVAPRRWISHADLNHLVSRPIISITPLQPKCSLSRVTRRNRISTQRNRSRPRVHLPSIWTLGFPTASRFSSDNPASSPGCTQKSLSGVSPVKTTHPSETKSAAKRSALPAKSNFSGPPSMPLSRTKSSIVSSLGLPISCHAIDACSFLRWYPLEQSDDECCLRPVHLQRRSCFRAYIDLRL